MKKTVSKPKPKTKAKSLLPDPPKPYGFCCDANRDEPLPRPNVDPGLRNVGLDAGGPNLVIKLEETDKAYFPPVPQKKRRASSVV